MPLYEYAVVLPDGSDGETFEVLQGMSEPALTHHPQTGQPVRRLLSAPNAPARKRAAGEGKADLSDKNLERLGFTKYRNTGDGTMEKTAGAGPDQL